LGAKNNKKALYFAIEGVFVEGEGLIFPEHNSFYCSVLHKKYTDGKYFCRQPTAF
jgi:hypothetical protein